MGRPSIKPELSRSIKLSQVKLDRSMQTRAQMDQLAIEEYAAAYLEGGDSALPHVRLFKDPDGSGYWVADGWHRIDAALSLGWERIKAFVAQGGRRQAILSAVGANSEHGVRRTNEDKRRSVRMLLEDQEWSRWSDREIARMCKVSHRFVGKMRSDTGDVSSMERTFTHPKTGQPTTMNTSNIGSDKKKKGRMERYGERLMEKYSARSQYPKPSVAPEGGDSSGDTTSMSDEAPPPNRAPTVDTDHAIEASEAPPGKEFSSDDWATPQDLFDLLDEEFSFTLDSCAHAETAKCELYWTPKDDALTLRWHPEDTIWMNPPYSKPGRWMEKAHDAARHGALVVCLVPAATGTNWWWEYARHGEIRLLRGRVRFVNPVTGKQEGAGRFDSAVVVFHPGLPGDQKMVYHWDKWNSKEAT